MHTAKERKLLKIFSNPDNLHLYARFFFKDHCQHETPEFHKEVFKLITDESKQYIAIAAPRNHAKSTIVNLIALSWMCVHEKVRFPIICSDSHSQAVLHLETLKREFEGNDRLRHFYGDLVTDKWAEDDIILKNNIRIKAIGQGMKLRGLKYGSARPDLFIADDLENDELVRSKDRIDRLERWLEAVVRYGLSKENGRVFYIGTILSYGSCLSRVLDKDRYPHWHTRNYAALMKDGKKTVDGDPIWPAKFTKQYFLNLRDQSAARGMLDVFYCESMNDPVSGMNQEFKPTYFDYYDELPEQYQTFTTVDLAISEKDHADYTVILTIAVDPDNYWYVVDVTRDRIDPKDTIDEIFRHVRKWEPVKVGIEGVGYQRALEVFIKDEMRRRNMYFSIEELKATRGTKEERIRALIPRYKQGTILHRRGLVSTEEMENELLKFPKGEHDDIIDALAYQVQITQAPRRKIEKVSYKGRVDVDTGLSELQRRSVRKVKKSWF